ncbi:MULTISPECIES: GNAT family N-acetyltransferase [unclassified Thiocapsa]|uniref:GNAT family N-acetyltransferase n=1 Tax=unclassified Thiocapsa TaxID=2641286 RepID=UPI0035B212F4
MLSTIRVERIRTPADRQAALKVLTATYQDEKRWVEQADSQIPESDLTNERLSWFLARRGGAPSGVLRIQYEPPVDQYRAYDIQVLRPGLDVDAFLRSNRLAEIGRFAIVPEHRRNLLIAMALMRAATRETVERGFTHYITDVFESDPHSPYGFHTRVMGFDPVATHDHGELACASRRITLILDLKAAYQRLRRRKAWIFRALTADWDEALHRRFGV